MTTDKMLGVTKTAPGYDQMALLEVDIPSPAADELLVKVAYTGICGSDIHTFKGEYNNPTTPVILGHEFSGQVVEVGADVTKFVPNDRVTSQTTFYVCNECEYCAKEQYNLCPHRKGIGTQQNGSMANYLLVKEKYAHKLPDSLSYKGAAMTEPLACCVHAMYQKSHLDLHDTILIIGPGPIGLYLVQIAKEIGSKVIVTGITRDEHRLALAQKMGADVVVNTEKEDLKEVILRETDELGVDKIYDASGAVGAINYALPLIRKGGEFIQVGLFKNKMNELDLETIIQREINYVGSRSQNPYDWPVALHLLAKGSIHIDEMITKEFVLADWRKAFESVMSGDEIKVMIKSNDF